jgi:hypothetical protein
MPPLCAQKPGCKPDQARFPASIWAGHLEPLARSDLEAQPFEQQPPASAQRHILESQQRPHSALSSSACMSSSEKPK